MPSRDDAVLYIRLYTLYL